MPVLGIKNVYKQLGKGIDYREVGNKLGVGACKKVNTAGTDENLFRLVPATRERYPSTIPLELVPMPGAQKSARAPSKGYFQTGTRAPTVNRALDALQCLVLSFII